MRATNSGDAAYISGVKCTRATDKAILVVIDGDEKWVPKSCLHDDSEVYDEGDEGELAVKSWWAEKEGLV